MKVSAMNVEFSEATDELLVRLSGQLGTSKAGVLRFGIALMQIAVKAQEQGRSIGVVDGDRVIREIVGVWTVPVAKPAGA